MARKAAVGGPIKTSPLWVQWSIWCSAARWTRSRSRTKTSGSGVGEGLGDDNGSVGLGSRVAAVAAADAGGAVDCGEGDVTSRPAPVHETMITPVRTAMVPPASGDRKLALVMRTSIHHICSAYVVRVERGNSATLAVGPWLTHRRQKPHAGRGTKALESRPRRRIVERVTPVLDAQ